MLDSKNPRVYPMSVLARKWREESAVFDSMPSPDENPQKRSRPAEAQPEVTQTPKRRRDEQDEDYQIGRGFYPPFVYQKEEHT